MLKFLLFISFSFTINSMVIPEDSSCKVNIDIITEPINIDSVYCKAYIVPWQFDDNDLTYCTPEYDSISVYKIKNIHKILIYKEKINIDAIFDVHVIDLREAGLYYIILSCSNNKKEYKKNFKIK